MKLDPDARGARRLALPRGLAPLGTRNYALYIAGHTVSHTGTAMELTATSWILYELTNSPILLGIGGLARTIPIVVFVLVGGAFADRFPRRRILFATQLSFLLTSASFGLLVLTGLVQPWHIYVFNFLSATINAFDVPARQALFPALVPRDQVAAAVTLNAVGARSGSLIGPAVAGIAIASLGNSVPFFVNAVSYLTLVAALLAMRGVPARVPLRTPVPGQVVEGLLFVRQHAILLPLLLLEMAASLFGHSAALLTIFARDVLHAGPEGLGLLRSSVAGGALFGMGALVFGRDIERKGLLMLGAGAVYSATLVMFALSTSLWLSLGLLFLLGVANALWSATRNVLAHLASPEAMRGRVMSLVVLVARGMTQLAELQAGAFVAAIGPAAAGLVGGGVVAAAVAVAATRSRPLRAFSARREPAATAVD